MSSVDNRIVNMQFNNREFEKNIDTSINSLDTLKKSLDFKGSEKGFDEVAKSSGLLGKAIDEVKVKFDALDVFAFRVFDRLANAAIDTGKKITSALTIEPIKTGFNEYEQKMDAVRVIMASTGEDLDTVNKKIQELNKYADDTIYSFSDMTLNIGKFTNAGVKLDDAVAAIKGVSNEAARSGANANEASRAMYNFAQALSMGYVQLIDWKSIENANMATVEFKNELLETALAEKIITKTSKGMYKTGKDEYNMLQMFKDGLKDQWLTSEVLIKTLKRYSDTSTEIGKNAQDAATQVSTVSKLWDTLREAAQSGWGNTWEIIIGDLDEAKKVLTEVSNVISGILDNMSNSRNEILKEWKELGGRNDLIETFRNIYKVITTLLKPIQEAFRDIFPKKTGKDLAEATKRFKEFTETLVPSEETLNKLKSIFSGIFSVLKLVVNGFKTFINIVKNLAIALKPFGEAIFDAAAALGDWISGVTKSVEASSAFQKIGEGIRNVFDFIGKSIKIAIDKIKEFLGAFSKKEVEDATLPLIGAGTAFEKLGEGIKITWNKIKNILSGAWGYLKGFLLKIKEGLEYFFGDLNFDTFVKVVKDLLGLGILNGFRKIVDGIGNGAQGLGGAFKNLSDIFKSLKNATDQITKLFKGLGEVLEVYKKKQIADILKTLAVSLLLVAASFFIISKIDSDKIASSMGVMTTMFIELIGSLALISKIAKGDSIKNLIKLSTTMIAFSVAVLLLASSLKKIADIDPVSAWSSVLVISALIGELVISMKLLSSQGDRTVIKGATALISLAIAVDLLVIAVKQFDGMDLVELAKGLAGVFTLCMSLVATVNLMNGSSFGINKGTGMILLATSLLILSNAVKKLGELDLPTLGKGMGFVAAGLLAMISALNAVPSGALAKSISIGIVSTSLLILGKAIKNVGSLDLVTLGKGLGFLAGGLLAIVAALFAVSNPLALVGASAILVTAGALIVLANALKITSSIGFWETIGGLTTLIALLGIVAGASILMTPIIPAILGVSVALAAFGAAVLILIAPLGILVNLMKSLIEWGPTGVQALTDFLTNIILLIPNIIKGIAEGLVQLAQVLIDGAPILLEAAITLFRTIIEAIVTVIPETVEGIVTLIEELLKTIEKHLPAIIESGWNILKSLLEGIRDHIQELVEIGADIIINFMKGIENKMPELVNEGYNLIITFIDTLGETIKDKTPDLVDHVWTLAENVISGLWNGLKHFLEKGKEKLIEIGEWIIKKFKEIFGIGPDGYAKKIFDIGGQVIEGMVKGFKEGLNSIGKAVEEVGENIVNGFKKFFGIKSPSRLMKDEVGNYIVDGIAEGIKENTSAEEAAKIKAQNIANAFKDEINKIDLSQTTRDLELKLWSAKYGDDATDLEYASRQMGNTKEYLDNLEKKQELAKREYEITSENLGEDAEETIKAYQSYLQAQINYIEKSKEYNAQLEEYSEMQKSYVQEQKDLEDSYYKYIITNGKTLKQLGYTNDQIQKAAKQATGFDPFASQPKMEEKVKEATLSSMEAVNTVYQENAENTFGALEPEFKSYGEKYGENLATGLESQVGLVTEDTTKLSDSSLEVLKNNTDEYYQAGVEAGKAYSSGLSQYANAVLNDKTGLNSKENSALKAAYASKTSEMKTKYSSAINDIAKSEGVDVGVAYEMLKANARGGSYGSGSGYDKSELAKDYEELASISQGLAVDNVAKIIKEGGDLTSISSGKTGISSSTSSTTAKSISSSTKSSSESSSKSSENTTNVNLTQNISSPKSISTTEVYRLTKTLLSNVNSALAKKGSAVASLIS